MNIARVIYDEVKLLPLARVGDRSDLSVVSEYSINGFKIDLETAKAVVKFKNLHGLAAKEIIQILNEGQGVISQEQDIIHFLNLAIREKSLHKQREPTQMFDEYQELEVPASPIVNKLHTFVNQAGKAIGESQILEFIEKNPQYENKIKIMLDDFRKGTATCKLLRSEYNLWEIKKGRRGVRIYYTPFGDANILLMVGKRRDQDKEIVDKLIAQVRGVTIYKYTAKEIDYGFLKIDQDKTGL